MTTEVKEIVIELGTTVDAYRHVGPQGTSVIFAPKAGEHILKAKARCLKTAKFIYGKDIKVTHKLGDF